MAALSGADAAVAQAPIKETPQVSALLPSARNSSGVGVQIVNAGFRSLSELAGVSNRSVPLFFVDYRVTPPDPKMTGGIEHPWAILKRLRGARGETIYPDQEANGGENLRAIFPRANPAWKSVTAIFEIVAPGAPANIDGKFNARYSLEGALPTRENPISTPNSQIETPQGTTVTLVSIEADYAASKTAYVLEIRRPSTATPATTSIGFQSMSVLDNQNRSLSQQRRGMDTRETQRTKMIFAGVPAADAVTATVSFDLIEQSARWRQPDYYKTLEIEVPVAALFALETHAPDDGKLDPTRNLATETYRAQNAEFRARIERLGRKEDFRANIWVAPTTAANADFSEAQTIAEPVAMRVRNAVGEAVAVDLEPKSVYYYFHDDSTPIAPGETLAEVSAQVPDINTKTTISLDVQSRQRAEYFLDVRDIPIQRGKVQFMQRPLKNKHWELQKVIWTDAETASEMERLSGGRLRVPADSLVLVLAHEPFAPDTSLQFVYANVGDDTGIEARQIQSLWNGDALVGHNGHAWTLVLAPPASDATRLDIRLNATEDGPIQSSATLEFPDVKWTNQASPAN